MPTSVFLNFINVKKSYIEHFEKSNDMIDEFDDILQDNYKLKISFLFS